MHGEEHRHRQTQEYGQAHGQAHGQNDRRMQQKETAGQRQYTHILPHQSDPCPDHLAQYMARPLRGLRVLELGCGAGYPGVYAAMKVRYMFCRIVHTHEPCILHCGAPRSCNCILLLSTALYIRCAPHARGSVAALQSLPSLSCLPLIHVESVALIYMQGACVDFQDYNAEVRSMH